jgi:hypothetical protein
MMTPGPGGNAGSGTAGAAMCGNGKAEGDEQCDGADIKGATCAMMMGNATGMLTCNSRCMLVTQMCFTSDMSGGGTGASSQGGSGARPMGSATGTAGAGGTGR